MYRLWAYDKNAKYISQEGGGQLLDPITEFGERVMPDTLDVIISVGSVVDLVKQASATLESRHQVAAEVKSVSAGRGYSLVIVSGHGAPGEQGCGSGQGSNKSQDISNATLELHSEWLNKLRANMELNGILFLSGCNVGEGQAGGELLQKLSQTYFPQIDCMAYKNKTENGIIKGEYVNKVSVMAGGGSSNLATGTMRLYRGGNEVEYDSYGYTLGNHGQELHKKFGFSIFGST